VAYARCCPGALGLESLKQQENEVFSPCSRGALGLHGFEREEESLMVVHFEQASACLK
jgi:hypothetical protein